MLNDWKGTKDPRVAELRAYLLACWNTVNLAWTHLDNKRTTTVKDVAQACMATDDEAIEGAWAEEAQGQKGK